MWRRPDILIKICHHSIVMGDGPPAWKSKMNILVADDDLISRKMLAGVLADWGHEVAVACDGTEAWRLLQERVPELAILDWMMPGLDGAELCRRVRKLQTPTPVYLILLTSRSAKPDIVAGLQAAPTIT